MFGTTRNRAIGPPGKAHLKNIEREAGTLSPLTVRRNEIEIERIERLFGSAPIVDLTTTDINKVYAVLRRKKTSPSSLHKLHAKLKWRQWD